jgi:hypothetical protein
MEFEETRPIADSQKINIILEGKNPPLAQVNIQKPVPSPAPPQVKKQ